MRYENTPKDERRYHYWRGFRAALVAVSPFIIALTIAVHILLDVAMN